MTNLQALFQAEAEARRAWLEARNQNDGSEEAYARIEAASAAEAAATANVEWALYEESLTTGETK